MPNYVTSNIRIDGPPELVTRLFDQIAFDGRPGTFDFEASPSLRALVRKAHESAEEKNTSALGKASPPKLDDPGR